VIAAVVLTYDAPDGMLADCVRSLLHTADEQLHVIVVDNGRRARPVVDVDRVHLIEAPTNLGYAGGMNLGIRAALTAGADAVMVLNDDVVVEPGWLPPLLAELDDPAVGAVQPLLLLAGEPPLRVNSRGVHLDRTGQGTDIGLGEPDRPDAHEPPTDLELFTGGAVLLRADFVRATGGFDERFFLYYEDVDLARRGAELGWRYRLAPASRVVHRGSATADAHSALAAFHRERNRLWTLWRHGSPGDLMRGLLLSIRRLRWSPRGVHAKALAAGVVAAPRLLVGRFPQVRRSPRQESF
jgi:GT2 family glycosyltransferase